MSIIDIWRERQKIKNEKKEYSRMVMSTIALMDTVYDEIWSEHIEIDRMNKVKGMKIAIRLIKEKGKQPGPNEEICQRFISFLDNVVADESISLKEIRDVLDAMMDRILHPFINYQYQYEMILALLRTEPMFRL